MLPPKSDCSPPTMFPTIERERTVIPRTMPRFLTMRYPGSVSAVVIIASCMEPPGNRRAARSACLCNARGDFVRTGRQLTEVFDVQEPQRVVMEIEHLLNGAIRVPSLLDDAIRGDGIPRAVLAFRAMHEDWRALRVGERTPHAGEEKHHVLVLRPPRTHRDMHICDIARRQRREVVAIMAEIDHGLHAGSLELAKDVSIVRVGLRGSPQAIVHLAEIAQPRHAIVARLRPCTGARRCGSRGTTDEEQRGEPGQPRSSRAPVSHFSIQNPYSRAGLSTRIFRCNSASGAICAKRSTRSPSFGMCLPTLGCGQSVPQRMRSGAASISLRAKGTASVKGGPFDDTRSGPHTLTQNFSCFIQSRSTLNAGCSRPSAAFTRPMWSITIGTGMRLKSASSSTRSVASRCRIRCQPMSLTRSTVRLKNAMSGRPPRCLTKLKRTPRMPPSCIWRNSRSP